MRRLKDPLVLVGLLLLGVALAIAGTRLDFLQGTPPAGARNDPAPEFAGIDGWLNSEPLTIAGLRGKVVLIDFWAYSCVNCVRTFPQLRQLYARYKPFGMEIVGVHSPEFEFEKQSSGVQEAIDRNQLPWPVALDNEMATWRAYRNRYWPHVYLIDRAGRIRFDHIGEGGNALIQDQLRKLLADGGGTLPEAISFEETTFTPDQTPEIYAGYERGSVAGSIGNPVGYRQNQTVDYTAVDPESIHDAGTDGAFFLEGRWIARAEYLEAAEDGARLVLPFFARDVFFVASSSAAGPVNVRLMLDGGPVEETWLGPDAPGGVVRVTRSDLYRLVRGTEANTHELTLDVDEGFRLYTFTFG